MLSQRPYLEPGAILASYQVEALIARGGMGEVYRARDTRLDRPVALKVLAPELSGNEKYQCRFIRESRLAAAVDHPNVIPIYEAGDADGQLYIAMRYVRGTDLRTELALRGTLDVDWAVDILHDTASALDAAHAAGLIHRDVKPANILLADDVVRGRRHHVYLSDFGLTRRSTSASGLTTAGHFLGTIDYVAPEQIRGEEVDGRADVYALACVAFALLTGHPPFEREEDTALLWAHIFEPPPRLADLRPDLPPEFDVAVAAALAKAPDDRPATCGEFVAMLDPQRSKTPVGRHEMTQATPSPTPAAASAPAGHDPPPSEEETAVPPETHRRSWPRSLVLGLPVAMLLLAVLAGITIYQRGSGDDAGAGDGDTLTPLSVSGLPYTLSVPAAWTPRTHEAGASTVTVASPADLAGLFADDPVSMRQAAQITTSDPESAVGLAIYHRTSLGTLPPAEVVRTAEALLPGQEGRLLGAERFRAGEVSGQTMEGTLPLSSEASLQVRVVSVDSASGPMLVFFAPPALFAEHADEFDRVVQTLRPAD